VFYLRTKRIRYVNRVCFENVKLLTSMQAVHRVLKQFKVFKSHRKIEFIA